MTKHHFNAVKIMTQCQQYRKEIRSAPGTSSVKPRQDAPKRMTRYTTAADGSSYANFIWLSIRYAACAWWKERQSRAEWLTTSGPSTGVAIHGTATTCSHYATGTTTKRTPGSGTAPRGGAEIFGFNSVHRTPNHAFTRAKWVVKRNQRFQQINTASHGR